MGIRVIINYNSPIKNPELRLEYVPRWSIVNTTKQQSVAEHSYNVAIISGIIAERTGEYDKDQINEIMVRALKHDVDEAYTGDIPSPAKEGRKSFTHYIIKLADLVESIRWIERNINDEPNIERWIVSELRNKLYRLLDENGLTYEPILKGLL